MEQGTMLGSLEPLTVTSSIEERVQAVITRIRPYIQSHGGDVWISGIENGILTLRIEGTCTHCPLAALTYNKVVKTLLGEEVPEITKIVLTWTQITH